MAVPNSTAPTTVPWKAEIRSAGRGSLNRDIYTDVCIIGGGIAGLAAAYELASQKRHVVVLDQSAVGDGETGKSSAHLSNVLDHRFSRIEELHGTEAVRLCHASHSAAIGWFRTVIEREQIACDFESVNGFLFLPPGEDPEVLTAELEAARRAGATAAEMLPRAPLTTFDTGRCIRFPDQAQVNPARFIAGLALAIERLNGTIYGATHAQSIENLGVGLRVHCAGGAAVTANSVVVATNAPINDLVTIHTKQYAYRTYAVAMPVRAGLIPRALYWDTSQEPGNPEGPYHYARLISPAAAEEAEGELLLVGGEDHKTGQSNDADERWKHLINWTEERFPVLGEARYRWSGQIIETMDHLAFIGRNPSGPEGVFVATGDCGMGLTHGAIAGMLISDLISGRANDWTALYDPARKTLRSAWTFTKENLNVASQYTDWLRGGDVASSATILPGEGAVIRSGLKMLACYRDPSGALHVRSAACPHLGGVVHWNSAERTWDCPCHGSRFDAYGGVLNGPATRGLSEVETSLEEHVAAS